MDDKDCKYRPGFRGFLGEFSPAFGMIAAGCTAIALSEYIDAADTSTGIGFLGSILIIQGFKHIAVFGVAAFVGFWVASVLKDIGTK